MSQGLKLLVELGPIVIFFGTYFGTDDLMVATGVFMIVTLAALAYARLAAGTWPLMLLITAAIVTVFGGLTLILQDETFIKMKPTIVYGIFAAVLLTGVALRRYWLQLLFASAFDLPTTAWHKLTIRWVLFFVAMGIANEYVWRTQSTDVWITFKFPTSVIITFLFAAAQTPFIMRNRIEESDGADD